MQAKLDNLSIDVVSLLQDARMPGPKGERGEQGLPGPKGSTGALGRNGLPGRKGDAGFDGRKGDKGSKGNQGQVGLPGLPGRQGMKGDPAGYPGSTMASWPHSSSEIPTTISTTRYQGQGTKDPRPEGPIGPDGQPSEVAPSYTIWGMLYTKRD